MHQPDRTPTLPLAAIGTLVIVALVAVTTVRLTGNGAMSSYDAPAVRERALLFEDRADGGVTIRDANANATIDTIEPGSNGFLRSAMRGLARERKRSGLGSEVPFRLIGRADGRLTLEDPATGRRIDLEAFGPTNAGVFARLLMDPPASAH
jgi:putative photosynthetic complex assembly protein